MKVCCQQLALCDSGEQRRAGLVGDLEPHSQAGLVLYVAGPGEDMVAIGLVASASGGGLGIVPGMR